MRGYPSDRYWDRSGSGVHQISRPIVIDGLRKPEVRIELQPRIRLVGGQLVDDSYRVVDLVAVQLAQSFTLEQLVMATVALRVHMRKQKQHLQRKKELQERWTELARRMKRLRVKDEHLSFDESRLMESRASVGLQGEGRESLEELLRIEEEDLKHRREAWNFEKGAAQLLWSVLEAEDERLLREAPHLEQTEDLRQPHLLSLSAARPERERPRRRSLAAAMNVLVEALEKPLSRTDQMLLEIALRRCIRGSASGPEEVDAEAWEKDLLRDAEKAFLSEFPWADAYLGTKSAIS